MLAQPTNLGHVFPDSWMTLLSPFRDCLPQKKPLHDRGHHRCETTRNHVMNNTQTSSKIAERRARLIRSQVRPSKKKKCNLDTFCESARHVTKTCVQRRANARHETQLLAANKAKRCSGSGATAVIQQYRSNEHRSPMWKSKKLRLLPYETLA